MGETIKKEVDTIIKTLNCVATSNQLSPNDELLLGYSFINIENYIIKQNHNEKNSLILLKIITFFKNIEWDLCDIKNSEHPNWKTNIPVIIKKIQAFMNHCHKKILRNIKEVEIKIQKVNEKLKDIR